MGFRPLPLVTSFTQPEGDRRVFLVRRFASILAGEKWMLLLALNLPHNLARLPPPRQYLMYYQSFTDNS